MVTRVNCRRRSAALLCFVLLLWSGSAINLSAQVDAAVPPDTSAKVPAYDVVSIKPVQQDYHNISWKPLPNGFDYMNLPLAPLLYQAYGITLDSQISGLPQWARTDYYNVLARMDQETAEAWNKLSAKDQAKQQQLMLQAMFADRCQLKMRREVKELEVYDLVIARDGIKMKEAAPDEKGMVSTKTRSWRNDASSEQAYSTDMTAQADTAYGLTENLPHSVGRLVVDKTGLGEKKFDYELKWSAGELPYADAASAGPSIFKALEEQLGLKLVPAKEQVDTFVVEHIEKPSPN